MLMSASGFPSSVCQISVDLLGNRCKLSQAERLPHAGLQPASGWNLSELRLPNCGLTGGSPVNCCHCTHVQLHTDRLACRDPAIGHIPARCHAA